jgi:hypothetical protein
MKKQSKYLIPNAGGYDSFVRSLSSDVCEVSPREDASPNDFASATSSGFEISEGTSSVSEPEVSPEEVRLNAPVEGILELMNSVSSKLNDCETSIHKYEQQRHQIAAEWREKKASLLEEIGQATIDRAKPVFEAYEEQLQLQQRVNEAAGLFQLAVAECEEMKSVLQTAHENNSTEDHLGHLLDLLVASQTKRDTYESLSFDHTLEFRNSQEICENLRREIGLRTIERAWPWYSGFLQCKGQSEECSAEIHRLRKERISLKEQYRECMQKLENISTQIHSIRNNES